MRKDYVTASREGTEEAFVAEMWDRVWTEQGAAAGRRRALRRSEEYRFLLDQVLPGPALDVLDCGSGAGDWTLLFREEGHRAIGIDIAARTVEKLREIHGESFRLADFRRTGLPAESFDLVVNWGGLEHFEEGPGAGIAEALRLLRPGGAFVATTPFHNARVRLLDRWRGQTPAAGPDVRFYQYRFTRDELQSRFREGGFESIVSRAIGGAQGMSRALQHELAPIGLRLPAPARAVIVGGGGALLRPWVGHMVICLGRKPRPA
jgi:SAM-dependent methyltransferase